MFGLVIYHGIYLFHILKKIISTGNSLCQWEMDFFFPATHVIPSEATYLADENWLLKKWAF